MAITRTTYPERVLIVLAADGSLRGAHQEQIETIADGGDVISTRQLSASPLDAATLATVLPDAAALLAQVQSLTDQLAAVTAERDAALSQSPQPEPPAGVGALSPVQVRVALRQAGITAAMVDAVMAAIPDDMQRDIATTYWEYATTIHRDHPLIGQISAALGLTSEQVDEMWSAAA